MKSELPFVREDIALKNAVRSPAGAKPRFNWRESLPAVAGGAADGLDAAQIAVNRAGNAYTVDVAVPLADVGLAPGEGKPLRGDFGVIYGDAAGTTNIFRNYWSNQATGLVNDVPGEIMLTPGLWGDITLEAKP